MSNQPVEAMTVEVVGGHMGSIPATIFGSSKMVSAALHASTTVHLTQGGWEIHVKSADNGSANWISVRAQGGGYPEVALFLDDVAIDAMRFALEDLRNRQKHAIFPEAPAEQHKDPE